MSGRNKAGQSGALLSCFGPTGWKCEGDARAMCCRQLAALGRSLGPKGRRFLPAFCLPLSCQRLCAADCVRGCICPRTNQVRYAPLLSSVLCAVCYLPRAVRVVRRTVCRIDCVPHTANGAQCALVVRILAGSLRCAVYTVLAVDSSWASILLPRSKLASLKRPPSCAAAAAALKPGAGACDAAPAEARQPAPRRRRLWARGAACGRASLAPGPARPHEPPPARHWRANEHLGRAPTWPDAPRTMGPNRKGRPARRETWRARSLTSGRRRHSLAL